MLIIHKNTETGGICITKPVNDSIEVALAKAVPEGVPYFIVEDDVIPNDYTFRGAWTVDFSNPDGVGIGREQWEATNEVKDDND
jgi:hypothetical protein